MLFRSDKNPTGPNLKKSKEVFFDFSGTKIRFMKPLSNGPRLEVDGNNIFPSTPNKDYYNIYDNNIYKNSLDTYLGLGLAFEIYSFKGNPLLGNQIGSLKFTAHLQRFKKSKNILDVKNYESFIDQELLHENSPKDLNEDVWAKNFPVFWHSLTLPNTPLNPWLCYAVQDMAAAWHESISYFVRTPITPEHDITFCFHALELDYESGAFELFRKICAFILKSIHIELNPSTKEEFKSLGIPKKFKFSNSKPAVRFDKAKKFSAYKRELVEDPNLFYKKHNKSINRHLI